MDRIFNLSYVCFFDYIGLKYFTFLRLTTDTLISFFDTCLQFVELKHGLPFVYFFLLLG